MHFYATSWLLTEVEEDIDVDVTTVGAIQAFVSRWVT